MEVRRTSRLTTARTPAAPLVAFSSFPVFDFRVLYRSNTCCVPPSGKDGLRTTMSTTGPDTKGFYSHYEQHGYLDDEESNWGEPGTH